MQASKLFSLNGVTLDLYEILWINFRAIINGEDSTKVRLPTRITFNKSWKLIIFLNDILPRRIRTMLFS